MITLAAMSHHTAPLEVRERLAITADALPGLLTRGRATFGASVLIGTCNRLELYVPGARDPSEVLDFLAHELDADFDTVERHFRVAHADEAVRHLYAVAAGVDSMVIGETEVLGQVRSAFSAMVAAGADNSVLSRLFHTAIRTGRRARNETGIGEHALSVSAIAAQQARDLFPDLAHASVLIVGAGEAAKLAAESLTGYGAQNITFINRTLDRADALAQALGGRAVPFAQLTDALEAADIVVAASGSPDPLFSATMVSTVVARREGAPLLLVDIALPRDFGTGVRDVQGVRYFDLDDLQAIAARNNNARLAEVDDVRAIVDEETARFVAWYEQLQVVPTIAALTDRAEAVRQAEVAKTLRRLKLDGAERAHVEELTDVLTKAIIRQLLHDPITSLRERGDRDVYVEALRSLFRLDDVEDADDALEDA